MSDNGSALGRGHRIPKHTPAMANYLAERNKSKQVVDSNAQTKNVRRQEDELIAAEQATSKSSHSANGKRTEKSTKSMAGPVGSSLDIDPEEARNIAKTREYEQRCLELQYMIFGRTGQPLSELKLMDGDELEKKWDVRPVASANRAGTSQGKLSAGKSRNPPAPMETPARRPRASKPVTNKISVIGSPLVPLAQAREQSA
ncbi:hypothetical protein RhiJN_01396 [Ceratobasidium sp. AG-Ba]|nr:hypothetical protein RhiJN_01396 [Ceratobasidium sp. AG-Ba]